MTTVDYNIYYIVMCDDKDKVIPVHIDPNKMLSSYTEAEEFYNLLSKAIPESKFSIWCVKREI